MNTDLNSVKSKSQIRQSQQIGKTNSRNSKHIEFGTPEHVKKSSPDQASTSSLDQATLERSKEQDILIQLNQSFQSDSLHPSNLSASSNEKAKIKEKNKKSMTY